MECDNCTLCCKLLNIEEKGETISKAGESCYYCDEGVGCKIYDERPEACREFECSWKQMEHAGIELRPDLCNVVFEKWSNYLILGVTDREELSELVMRQIDHFRSEDISVLMIDYERKTRTFFLAIGHTKGFIKKELFSRRKNGSTGLYN